MLTNHNRLPFVVDTFAWALDLVAGPLEDALYRAPQTKTVIVVTYHKAAMFGCKHATGGHHDTFREVSVCKLARPMVSCMP